MADSRNLVAVTRWARPPEQELVALAPLFGVTPYDLRLRLLGPLPVVAAQGLDAQAAAGLLQALRARGHGALACDQASIPRGNELGEPRDFSLEPDALVLAPPCAVRLGYAGLEALVLATRIQAESSTTAVSKKGISVARALATGGLSVRSKKTKNVREQEEIRELVLYLYAQGQPSPFRLCESSLRYGQLAELMAPTRGQNFQALVAILRERGGTAWFDDRMVTQTRKPSLVGASIGTKQLTESQSNAIEIDLAAHLLVLAHREQQL
jgi:hypothetical protein